MEVILLEVKESKINNALDSSENNQYILKTHRFYFIQSKNSKYMDKILKNFTLLKVKLHTWFIILKESISSEDFL